MSSANEGSVSGLLALTFATGDDSGSTFRSSTPEGRLTVSTASATTSSESVEIVNKGPLGAFADRSLPARHAAFCSRTSANAELASSGLISDALGK